jgi:hypothetical protein
MVVKRFIEKDLIYQYGPLEKIVTDNAQNFNGKIDSRALYQIKNQTF